MQSSSIFSQENSPQFIDEQVLTILYSTTGCISFLISLILAGNLHSKKKQLREIESSKILSLEELYENLIKNQMLENPQLLKRKQLPVSSAEQQKKKKLEEQQQMLMDFYQQMGVLKKQKKSTLVKPSKYFFVYGTVAAPKTQQFASIDLKEKLVYSKINVDKLYLQFDGNNGYKKQKINIENYIKSSSYFCLQNLRPKNFKISEFSTLQSETEYQIHNFKKSNFQKVLHHICTLEKMYQNFKFGSTLVAGTMVNIGLVKNQIGIKIGDPVLVYGKVVWDIDKNIIRFNAPKYIVQTKEQLCEMLKNKISTLKIGIVVFTILGTYQISKLVKHLFFKPPSTISTSNNNSSRYVPNK